jgi:hypothetical protein
MDASASAIESDLCHCKIRLLGTCSMDAQIRKLATAAAPPIASRVDPGANHPRRRFSLTIFCLPQGFRLDHHLLLHSPFARLCWRTRPIHGPLQVLESYAEQLQPWGSCLYSPGPHAARLYQYEVPTLEQDREGPRSFTNQSPF